MEFWKNLDEIIEMCNELDIDLFVFIVPTKEQVDPESLTETMNYFQLDASSIELSKPQDLISTYLAGKNITNYDLLDTLREANILEQTYFDLDSHWNIYGNDVVASYIFNTTKSFIKISSTINNKSN